MNRNRIKLLVIIVLLFSLFACKKELANENRFIENLSNDENFDLPLYNESLMIFINKNDTVYITSLRQLYSIKEKHYKDYKDFDSFLIKVLNANLLSKSDLIKNSIFTFELNKTVLNEFNSKGLDYLKKTYCERANVENKFYIINNLSLDIKQSVMYFFFKNNYYIMQNDHSGKYVLIDKN
ncbi:hypothetical protein RYR30_002566 [Flavobacterium psychrophilum]|nr:hypothetical protein [Flavobacterium psychrophilum]ELM3651564.1 hypothetical protein [Flavobacterium psychrophilum]ELM3672586.1 hypothetical protein [Flavobacterium psychrophilum]ELM3727129.1 hypothetical protein [Flavobacterium psychrophilum]